MSRETHLSPNCDEAHEKVEMNKITKNCQRRFEKKKLQKQMKERRKSNYCRIEEK